MKHINHAFVKESFLNWVKRWKMKWQFFLMAWILDIGLLASRCHSSAQLRLFRATIYNYKHFLSFQIWCDLYIQFVSGLFWQNIVSCCKTTTNPTCDMKPYILSIDSLEFLYHHGCYMIFVLPGSSNRTDSSSLVLIILMQSKVSNFLKRWKIGR